MTTFGPADDLEADRVRVDAIQHRRGYLVWVDPVVALGKLPSDVFDLFKVIRHALNLARVGLMERGLHGSHRLPGYLL